MLLIEQWFGGNDQEYKEEIQYRNECAEGNLPKKVAKISEEDYGDGEEKSTMFCIDQLTSNEKYWCGWDLARVKNQ